MMGLGQYGISRRRFVGLVGALAVPALAAACGGNAQPAATSSSGGSEKPASSAPKQTVRWQSREGDAIIKSAQQFLADTLQKQKPNLTVTIEPAPDGRDEKLVAAMVGGNAPDVFETWTDNVTQFADRGQVQDVEQFAKRDFKDADIKDFYPWQWHDFVLPSQIRFGVPKYVNVMVMRYNKDLFDKAGVKYPDEKWTHDDYYQAAQKLTVKKGDQVDQFGLYYPVWSWDRFWYRIEMWGGTVVDEKDTTKAAFDSDKALAAFEWSRKMMWDDQYMAQRLLLAPMGQSYDDIGLFAAGKWAMQEDGFYPYRMAQTIEKKIKWAWAHVPTGPVKRRVLGTTDGWAMWKGTKVQDGAWELMKFQSGPDYQLHQTEVSGSLPIRFSTLAKWKEIVTTKYPELKDANIDIGPQAMNMGYAGNRVLFKKDAEARQIIQPALEKVFISGGAPVSYFKDIVKQVNDSQK